MMIMPILIPMLQYNIIQKRIQIILDTKITPKPSEPKFLLVKKNVKTSSQLILLCLQHEYLHTEQD